MFPIKIGVVATLSGPTDKLGRGVLRSAEFSAEAYMERHSDSLIKPIIVANDDFASVQGALQAVENSVNQGCIVIVGPADSDSMFEVLRTHYGAAIPIISTIATATSLASLGNENFLRCTTPDLDRCEILVRNLLRFHPTKTVRIYAKSGTPQSYGQAAKQDLLTVCSRMGLKTKVFDFSTGKIEVELPDKKEPFVIAAPSSDGVTLLKYFRSKNRVGQAYSFGSSTSWLKPIAQGTIVVCDLDRDDLNIRIRDDLDSFFKKHSAEQDPSLTTKNALYIICVAAEMVAQNMNDGDSITSEDLLRVLKSETLRGLYGELSFSTTGEMLGYEQISVLSVTKKKGGLIFQPLEREAKAILYDRQRFRRYAWTAFAFFGTLASIVGLAYTFFSQ